MVPRVSKDQLLRFLVSIFLLLSSPLAAEVTVFAAASLRGALDEVHAISPETVTTSYASSAALARQIAQGAPADVFISANQDWALWLEERGLVEASTAQDLLGNRLVLIASKEAPAIALDDLGHELGSDRLAVALIRAVPAGIYAREALSALGQWEAVAANVIETENVRAALRFVALGEARYGITYLTDALAEPRVRILKTLPDLLHSPIRYRVVEIAASPETQRYLAHLTSPMAQEIFEAHGFIWRPDS